MNKKYSADFIARFKEKCRPAESGCIEWTGAKMGNGYGIARLGKGRSRAAHRVAFEIAFSDVPDGLLAMHICDNRLCVNVDHIVLGTNMCNMLDMRRKHRAAAGSKHPASKLTPEQVREIRQLGKEFYGVGHGTIAKQFGVSRPTITKILNGSIYKYE